MARPWITLAELGAPDNTYPDAQLAIEAASWILFKLTAQKYPGINEITEEYTLNGSRYLVLKHTPAHRITALSVDGIVQDATQIKIGNYKFIDLGGICGATVSVTYTYGMLAPEAGKNAAIVLTRELLAASNGSECRLPNNVTDIARQGISMSFGFDDYFDKGRTGIAEIDLFITTSNPGRARQPSKIYSPHVPKAITYR